MVAAKRAGTKQAGKAVPFSRLLGDDSLAAHAVKRGDFFTEEQLLRLVRARLKETAWEVAKLDTLTPKLLEALSTAPSVKYRDTPWIDEPWPESLGDPGVFISDDRRFMFMYPQVLVAMHPLTPEVVLLKLQRARSRYVRAAVASRDDVSSLVLCALAGDADVLVRTAVHRNPVADDEHRAKAALLGVSDDAVTEQALTGVTRKPSTARRRGASTGATRAVQKAAKKEVSRPVVKKVARTSGRHTRSTARGTPPTRTSKSPSKDSAKSIRKSAK